MNNRLTFPTASKKTADISIPSDIDGRDLKKIKKYISVLEKFMKWDKKPYIERLVIVLQNYIKEK